MSASEEKARRRGLQKHGHSFVATAHSLRRPSPSKKHLPMHKILLTGQPLSWSARMTGEQTVLP